MEKRERRHNLESGSVLTDSLATGDAMLLLYHVVTLLEQLQSPQHLFHMHLQCRQMPPPHVSVVQSNLPSLRWQGPHTPSLSSLRDESSLQAEGPHCPFLPQEILLAGW